MFCGNKKRRNLAGKVIASITLLTVSIFAARYYQHTAAALGQLYIVTNTNDSGPGYLRQAITDANANATLLNGEPHQVNFNIPGTGVQTINLASALLTITMFTIIDGTSQPGSACGDLVPSSPFQNNTPHILKVEIISSHTSGSAENTLNIGSTASGSTIKGLAVTAGTAQADTAIATSAAQTTISCNYLGTRADGITITTQEDIGIRAQGQPDNLLVASNVIVAKATAVNAGGTSTQNMSGVTLKDNLVGVDATTKHVPYPRDWGIFLAYADNVTVGSTLGEGNVIGGFVNHNQGALWIGSWPLDATNSNITIQGNYIGMAPDNTPVPNGIGILIDSTDKNVLISGDQATQRNMIAGNLWEGMNLYTNSGTDMVVKGNYIGIGADGKTAVPNNGNGIRASGMSSLQIGGSVANDANIVSGNNANGISIADNLAGPASVIGNYIGVDKDGQALGNQLYGIETSSKNVTIGGLNGAANIIANNKTGGVSVNGNATSNTIRQNSIYANANLGIDLAGNGPTPNDIKDPDTGPNNLQNYPVFSYSMTSCDGSAQTAPGSLNSTPDTTFTIDYYANPSWSTSSGAAREGEQ